MVENVNNIEKPNVGSSPSFSASKFPNIFNINMLGFFISGICTIIVRSDIKSQKNLA